MPGLADRVLSSTATASSSSTCTVQGSSSSSSSSSGSHHAHEAVLFPFISVLIGCVITHYSPRLRMFRLMPYTVWLFLIGVGLGLLDYNTNYKLGTLSDSMSMWMNIDPHVLLYTFLPVLLFGDSMKINFHDFTRCAAQCTVLAGPGVLMGTGIMYVVSKMVFPYDWTPNEAAAFASILAATDPVAVVALLNEMGASRTLTMQIAGESLLNDGMAIVVWTLFDDMMMGTKYSAGDIIGKFCRLAIGGVVWGLIVGMITLRGIALCSDKLIHTDHLVQLAVTFIAAYLSFFIGENELKVSGVLSTIFAALVLGKAAWPLICSPEAVTDVWHTAEFFGNTILFMLCGMVFFQSTITVEAVDWLWLLLLYAIAVVARGIMLVILFPILNMVAASRTAKLSWRELCVLTWGGLRGAVGLALALSMRSQLRSCDKKHTGDLMVFFVGGFAGLTLLVNATTCGVLLERLEMTTPADVRKQLLGSLQVELLEIARELCSELIAHDMRFSSCNADDVLRILEIQKEHSHHAHHHDEEDGGNNGRRRTITNGERLSNHNARTLRPEAADRALIEAFQEETSDPDPTSSEGSLLSFFQASAAARAVRDEIGAKGTPIAPPPAAVEAVAVVKAPSVKPKPHWWWGFEPIAMDSLESTNSIDSTDMAAERGFYLSMLKAQYSKQLREDMIPRFAQGAIDLPSSIDRSYDYAHDELRDWDQLQKLMLQRTDSNVLEFLKIVAASPYDNYEPQETIDDNKVFDLFSVVVFLDAHHIVCAEIAHREQTVAAKSSARLSQVEACKHSKARTSVMMEAGNEVEDAHQFLIRNQIGKDQICTVRTKQLLALLYARQMKQIEKWLDRGIINAGEAEELMHPVHKSTKRMRRMRNFHAVESIEANKSRWIPDLTRTMDAAPAAKVVAPSSRYQPPSNGSLRKSASGRP